MKSQGKIFILSTDDDGIDQMCSIIHESRFQSEVFHRLEELTARLKDSACLAAILDTDSVPLSNRNVRILKECYPHMKIFCTSARRLHPELQDAISRHICACLNKPIDPDELLFWLRSIHDGELKSPPG